MEIEGVVCSGRGKATNRLKCASQQIGEMLGCKPIDGTLNLTLSRPIEFDPRRASVNINNRVLLWRATLDGTDCLIYRFPLCPLHVVEIVSATHLRTALGLADGKRAAIGISDDITVPVPLLHHLLWRLLWGGKERHYYSNEPYVRRLYRHAKPMLRASAQPLV